MSSGPRSRAGRTTAIHRNLQDHVPNHIHSSSHPVPAPIQPASQPLTSPAPNLPHHIIDHPHGKASRPPTYLLSLTGEQSQSPAQTPRPKPRRAPTHVSSLCRRALTRGRPRICPDRGGVGRACAAYTSAAPSCSPATPANPERTRAVSSVRHRGTLWISMASSGHQHVANAGAPRTRLPEKKSVSRHLATCEGAQRTSTALLSARNARFSLESLSFSLCSSPSAAISLRGSIKHTARCSARRSASAKRSPHP